MQPHLIDRLLRHEEVEIDRVERLQGDHHGAGAEVLPEIDARMPR